MGKKVKIGKVKIKEKCCVSATRCGSCPIRVLKEGRMPEGYTVHKRKLVTVEQKTKILAKAAKLKGATPLEVTGTATPTKAKPTKIKAKGKGKKKHKKKAKESYRTAA